MAPSTAAVMRNHYLDRAADQQCSGSVLRKALLPGKGPAVFCSMRLKRNDTENEQLCHAIVAATGSGRNRNGQGVTVGSQWDHHLRNLV